MADGAEQSGGAFDPELYPGIPESTLPGTVGVGLTAQRYMQEAQDRAARSGKIGDIEFDEEGVDTIIQRIGRVRDKWEQNLERAQDLTMIDPGAEYASAQYAETANAMGQSYLNYLERNIAAYEKFLELLEQVKRDYLTHEQDVADTVGGVEA